MNGQPLSEARTSRGSRANEARRKEEAMAGGFSTGVRLSNLNDFIAPSQSCVVMNTVGPYRVQRADMNRCANT